ncbi:unnamed protein product [Timema podura]|uniref:GDNF/GAS1 domain-containing protein n=1 Tax=Timema podura TaxID=61482 RepID=A0ABN7NR96_TIMPD|nr:unnamed protein product [Timema podura]
MRVSHCLNIPNELRTNISTATYWKCKGRICVPALLYIKSALEKREEELFRGGNEPQYTRPVSKPALPIIGNLVYCDSSALDSAATEAGDTRLFPLISFNTRSRLKWLRSFCQLESFTGRIAACDCVDDFCLDAKRRVEVCRPHVLIAMRNETVVSCRLAQWICAADALCSTALEYYNRFCRSMFHGKKCTHRCNNSISILRRQEKAAKLNTCICDGHEEYDCPRIQTNMARLCFNQEPAVAVIGDMHTNEVKAVSTAGSGTLRVTPKLTWASLLLLWRLLVHAT